MSVSKAEMKTALTKAFKEVDTDNSGEIDCKELERILTCYYKSSGKQCDCAKIKAEAQAFLKDADKDDSNTISLDEFVKYFTDLCCKECP